MDKKLKLSQKIQSTNKRLDEVLKFMLTSIKYDVNNENWRVKSRSNLIWQKGQTEGWSLKDEVWNNL